MLEKDYNISQPCHMFKTILYWAAHHRKAPYSNYGYHGYISVLENWRCYVEILLRKYYGNRSKKIR